MKTLVIQLLEILACSGVLLAAYTILLERRVSYRWCRAYLLLSTPLAAVIPLLRIPVWPAPVLEAVPFDPEPVVWTAAALPDPPALSPVQACAAIALLGTTLITALMLWQVVRIRRLRRGAAIDRTERFTLVRTRQRIASFSFFRSVYVWRETPEEELRAILAHEASHIAHRHSVERIVMESLKALLWWNPFVWIAARRLTEVEEFEADHDVLTGGYDREQYMHAIFRQLFGYSPEIANGLRDSLTKKRFKMMTTQTPGRYALLRLAATLPVVIGLLAAFSFTTRAAAIVSPEKVPADAVADGKKTAQVTVCVRDKALKPLAGAIVALEGSATGTVTDRNGEAQLTVPAGSQISVMLMGYQRKTVTPDGREKSVTVTLAEDATPSATAAPVQSARRSEGKVTLKILLIDRDGKSFSSENVAAGAAVSVVGTSRGTVADRRGHAEIAAEPGTVLEIAYPDYAKASVAVGEESQYFVLLRPEGSQSEETPIFSRDEEGVKQRPLYIVDGVESPFSPELDANRIDEMRILKGDEAVARYGERGRNGVVEITTGSDRRQTDADVDEPYLVAETMPLFQGRDLRGFREWVQTHVKYPFEAMARKVQGRVVVTFVVERDGSVSSVQVAQSPDKLLADEARRVIGSSPAWTPGKQRGQNVRVKFTLPVDFHIQTDNAPATREQNAEEEAYLIAEQMPQFQGGDLNAFRGWVQTQVKWPAEAVAKKIRGRVVASFVVEKNGAVGSIRIIQSPDKLLSDEVLRVLSSSPAWTPGRQRGAVVRVRFVIPVDFTVAGSGEPAPAPAAATRETAPASDAAPDTASAGNPDENEPPLLQAETMPSFRGGDLGKFRQWAAMQLARQLRRMGKPVPIRARVRFIVEKDGRLSHIRIQGIGRNVAPRIQRILASSPAWTPGMQDGKPVRVQQEMFLTSRG